MERLKYKKLSYLVSLPKDYPQKGKYPLLVFLHGAGTRGKDMGRLLQNPFFTEAGDKLAEFIVAAPQCYADSWFDVFEQLHEWICHVMDRSDIDQKRCYLMGASMGGYAVWQEAMSHPELYAAIVPICGGGMYWNAARLKNIKIRAFHGSDDCVVYPEESRKMVDAAQKSGCDAKLTLFEGVAHDSWSRVYRDESIFKWLLQQKKERQAGENLPFNNPKDFG